MNYDFQRNFTSTFNNGVSTQFVTTRVRPLSGLFGPKFQTPGPFKFFVTGKVGFINFTKTDAAVTPGTISNAISASGYGGAHCALYPGGGLDGFLGPCRMCREAVGEVVVHSGSFRRL